MTDLSIDVSQLKKLSADLRRVSPALQKNFLKGLGLAGDVVASAAKSKARSFPRKGGGTDRIAGSIKVRRRGVSVRVQAGGPGAPEAAPIDNRGDGGTFRHPLFGNYDVWKSQPAHPFLENSAEEKVGEVEQIILGVTNEAFIAGGFSG